MGITLRLTSFFVFWLTFATSSDSAYVPCTVCIERASPSLLANIKLRLYTGPTINDFKSVLVDDALDLLPLMDKSKSTIVYISGWRETPDDGSGVTVVDAYLQRGDHNIIVVDWQVISTLLTYPYVANSVEGVGYTVAMAINELVKAGLNSDTIHIIGHSLGAQTSGFVGRNLAFKASRITGLDPAGPGYKLLIDALTSADAKFVDLIHTNSGVFGNGLSTGTVNFYPNGGISPQPGCALSLELPDACSHARSWMYYAESLLNESAFIGVECSLYTQFTLGLTRFNKAVTMGYKVPTTATGNVCLQTNSVSQFGRGKNGKTFKAVNAAMDLLRIG